MTIRDLVVSLSIGLVVGVIYGSVGIRSPAPPVVALLGLLGMLGGEQAVAFARAHWKTQAAETWADRTGGDTTGADRPVTPTEGTAQDGRPTR